VIDGGLHRATNGLGAGLVTGRSRQSTLLGPAAIAIHNDGHVARDGT
jgi:hypothetical protein